MNFMDEISRLPGEFLARQWVPTNDINFNDWQRAYVVLFNFWKDSKWWIGDVLNFGNDKFGEDFAQVLPMDHTAETLRNYMWVSSRVKPTNRVDLSHTHHKLVARFQDSIQRELLTKALEEEWSTRQLELYIRDKYAVEGDLGGEEGELNDDPISIPADLSSAAMIIEDLLGLYLDKHPRESRSPEIRKARRWLENYRIGFGQIL